MSNIVELTNGCSKGGMTMKEYVEFCGQPAKARPDAIGQVSLRIRTARDTLRNHEGKECC